MVFFRGGFLVSTKVEGGRDQIVFRKTHGHSGRRVSVTPGNSAMRHLAYGRIILNAAAPAESLSTGERETGLIVLSGNATVTDDRGQRGITGTVRRDLHSTRFFSEDRDHVKCGYRRVFR